MKLSYVGVAALTASLLAGAAQAAPAVTGDYVESRSANVYVGACHHEGEIQTAGRNALLAWSIADGEHNGVRLAGVTAVAVVAGDKSLTFDDAKRRSVLYVSDKATPAQHEALVALLKERAPKALGELVAVKSAPVSFDARGDMYRVQVAGAASLKIKKQAGELCCKQPYEVWGKPFVPVKAAKTGFCVGVEYKDAGLLQSWRATEQNNAFFGEFAL
jgi:hypothetical protein